jgi:membrane peptidoglycan carboxypeptidase
LSFCIDKKQDNTLPLFLYLVYVEAYFISSVKYNPFTKTSIETQERSKKEAFKRKNYVLDRMLKGNKISLAEYTLAYEQPVPFNQGKFQFNELN